MATTATNLSQPAVVEGPPPIFVESVFFKKLLDVQLDSPVEGLVERGSQALACSNKHGVMVVGGQAGGVVIVRPDDVLAIIRMANASRKEQLNLKDIPHVRVKNAAFSSPPCCIAISQGDEFIALDTDRGGTPVVLIFRLKEFLLNKGNIPPYCEVRASSSAGSKVCDIAWNPGENMGNMVAIDSDDGALQLATIKGENCVEVCSYKDGGVRCICWSPKGKQLVVGRSNGNLSQLKLDLSEAKSILGPGGGLIPGAVHWTSTTQFLVLFIYADADLDFMQLDLAKGSPPTYSSYGDIFVSDRLSGFSKCFFMNIQPWNLVVCPSNTINDVPLLIKGLEEGNKENWTVAEIDDNRRGAFPIDNYCVGAALYTGWKQPTVFSESESFGPMPYVFGVSNEGALFSAAVVNADPNAACVVTDVPEKLKPDVLYRKDLESGDGSNQAVTAQRSPSTAALQQSQQADFGTRPTAGKPVTASAQFSLQQQQQTAFVNTQTTTTQVTSTFPFQQQPQPAASFSMPQTTIAQVAPNSSQLLKQLQQPTAVRAQTPVAPVTTSFSPVQQQQQRAMSVRAQTPRGQVTPNPPLQQQQQQQQPTSFVKPRPIVASNANESEISQLRSMLEAQSQVQSQSPQMKQVEELKQVIDNRRDQIVSNERDVRSVVNDAEKPGEDYGVLALEVKKFQQRLDAFKRSQTVLQSQVEAKLVEVIAKFENEVVVGLKILQDFVEAVRRSTDAQAGDIRLLQEKVLAHFTDVEYAKSLNERNKDPNYVQLLKSQPMDPSTMHKFREIEKLFRYVTNQVREVERMNIERRRDDTRPLEGSAAIQSIYQTLSNHSRIIKRLVQNLNDMRAQVGLCKCPDLDENMEVFEPTKSLGYGYFDKKPMLKGKPSDFNCTSNQKNNRHRTISHTYDRPSLDDLTAGMTRMHLEKEQLRLPERKSLRISAKKLDVLTKAVTKTVEIDVSREQQEPAWVDSKSKATPVSRSIKVDLQKKLLSQIDDKTLPPAFLAKNVQSPVKVEELPVSKPSSKDNSANPSISKATSISVSKTALPSSISPSVSSTATPPAPAEPVKTSEPRVVYKIGSPAVTEPPKAPAPVATQPMAFTAPLFNTSSPAVTATAGSAGVSLSTPASSPSIGFGGVSITPVSVGAIAGVGSSDAFKNIFAGTGTPAFSQSFVFGGTPGVASLTPISTSGGLFSGGGGFLGTSASLTSTTTATSAFGSPSIFGSPPDVAVPAATSPSADNMFGGSSAFGGLGAKPSTDAASKNAFGGSSAFGLNATPASRSIKVDHQKKLLSQIDDKTPTFPANNEQSPAKTEELPVSTSSSKDSSVNSSSSKATSISVSKTTLPSSISPNVSSTATPPAPAEPVKTSEPRVVYKIGSPAVTEPPKAPAPFSGDAPKPLFGEAPTITSFGGTSSNIFGTLATTSPSGGGGLLGDAPPNVSLFSKPQVTGSTSGAVPEGLFSAPASAASLQTSLGGFSFLSASASSPSVGFGGVSITPVSTGAVAGAGSSDTSKNIFGGPPAFSQASAASVFGGTSGVASLTPISTSGGLFSGGGGFLGTPASPTATTTTTSAFGSPSIFGSPPDAAVPAAASPSPDNIFGGSSAFGGLGAKPSADAASKNVFGGSSAFGSNAAPSLFGGGQSASGSEGLFSGGAAPAIAQTGFSFSSPTKPPATAGFGAPAVFGAAATPKAGFGSAPVFGGSPAFGSTSPFGSAFGSNPAAPTSPATAAPSSPFGGGSIFGGGSAIVSDAPSFGALAQSAQPAQPQQQSVFGGGFGGVQGGSVFGGGQQANTNASLFAQPAAQASPFGGSPTQAPKTGQSFGGSAFSSWR